MGKKMKRRGQLVGGRGGASPGRLVVERSRVLGSSVRGRDPLLNLLNLVLRLWNPVMKIIKLATALFNAECSCADSHSPSGGSESESANTSSW